METPTPLQFEPIKTIRSSEQVVRSDFSVLLQEIGLSETDIQETTKKLFELLDEDISPAVFEENFKVFIFAQNVGDKPFKDAFEALQTRRSERIYSEVADFIQSDDKVLDFGCGNGLVGQLLHDRKSLEVEGCDVVVYKDKKVTIPVHKYDGYLLDVPNGSFETGYANSVLHHDIKPNKAIEEISRVVSKKFILIEDTLQGKTEEEIALHAQKLFVDDYIYNRLLVNGDIPVPAKYKTASKWIEAFSFFGWKRSQRDELGWSKILPSVFRERFIFERN